MAGIAIFYINLAQRPDRRIFMERQFAALGLEATRVEAVTPADLTPEQIVANCLPHRPLGLSAAELACTLSHVSAWRRFLASDARLCLVLEDDTCLSSRLPALLDGLARLPRVPGIVKLDSVDRPLRLDRPMASPAPGLELRRLYSRINCACAYTLTRLAATRLLAPVDYLHLPADYVLFDPYGVVRRRQIRLAQLTPAVAVSVDQIAPADREDLFGPSLSESDITAARSDKDRLQATLMHRDRWAARRRQIAEELSWGVSKFLQDYVWGIRKHRVPFEP